MEHAALLASLGADVREVRLPQEFEGLDGIVLPGEHANTSRPCSRIIDLWRSIYAIEVVFGLSLVK